MFLNNELFYEIAKQLDLIFKDVDKYRDIYEIERAQAEYEINLYSELKEKAVLGEKTARDYIINQFTKLLSTKIFDLNDQKLQSIINFDEPIRNNVRIVFEMLLDIYDISEIIDRYTLQGRISEADIKKIALEENTNIRERYEARIPKLQLIAAMAYSFEYGQDCIDTLQQHNINEIGIIDKDYVYLVYKGSKLLLDFLRFEDKSIILNIQKKTTQNSVINFDEQNPTLVTAKNNSSRITVAGYDATPTDEDLYYNERIFNLKRISLEEMRDSYNTINNSIYELLVINQRGRGSHFVTGSDMGVGKSTFLLAMMEKVPDRWGIGILDTQNELQARKKYPWKNILTLLQNSKRTISDCFVIMLKMARDVLYVGEITAPAEVSELINSSLRLNAGVGATMHSLSPFEVVTNIRNLMMRTEMYNNPETAEADIARGLDIIIHLARHPDNPQRIIAEYIVEVEFLDQNIYLEAVLEGTNRQKLSNLLNMAQLALRKYLYSKNYVYNVLFRFDSSKDTWEAVNPPSEKYFSKISKYVSEGDIELVRSLFQQKRAGYKENEYN